jgi:hypothetical protein
MPSRCGAPLPHTLWTGPMRGKSPTEEMGQPQSIMALGEHTWSPIPQQKHQQSSTSSSSRIMPYSSFTPAKRLCCHKLPSESFMPKVSFRYF